MKNIFYLCFISSTILLTASSAFAAHVFGTDLSYKCLGNNQYEITLRMYRDCGGTSAPLTMQLEYSSFSCNQIASPFNLSLDTSLSGQMVTALCSSFSSNSSCNGGSLPGEDLAVYKGIISLPYECPDWVISFTFSTRSSYYTNLTNPASGDIYIETTLDNTFGNCFDSPQFINHPMLYACAGQAFSYDMGALDFDGDTLLYTLLTPLSSPTQNANFQPGLSTSKPLSIQNGTNFILNNRTGLLTFTPQSGLNQFAALSIKVDKWHQGKIVASTIAEMDIAVNSFCSNASIEATNIQSTSNGWHYNDSLKAFISCNGQTTPFSFSITAHDLNGNNIKVDTSLFNLDSIFGAGSSSYSINTSSPYSADSALITIQINPSSTPLPSNGSHSAFQIGLSDETCPYSSTKIFTFVALHPFIKASVDDNIVCAGTAQSLQLSATGSHSLTNIQWTQIPTSAPTIALNNSTIDKPTVSLPTLPPTTLKYEVSAMLDNCLAMDTISIHIVDTPNLSFQNTLASNSTASDGSASVSIIGNLATFDYTWGTGSSSTTIDNVPAGTYAVTVTDFYGCQATDTTTVSFDTPISKIKDHSDVFSIFPNPLKDKTLAIHFHRSSSTPIEISLINNLGQLIFVESHKLSSSSLHIALDHIPTGIYCIHLKMNTQSYVQKVVVD